jgi:hypothetical protein
VGGTNTGGGGGGRACNTNGSHTGGSGIVVIKQTTPKCASGVWSINDVYDNVKAGTWI